MTDKYQKYVKGIDFTGLPDVARPAMIALGQYQCGHKPDQVCPDCKSSISVESASATPDKRPTAWIISCGCGACNGTFRGL